MMAGLRQGKMELAGAMPSATNPPGSPPPAFPLANQFQQVIQRLNTLSAALMKLPQDGRQASHKVTKLAVDLQAILLDQEKKYTSGMEAAQSYGGVADKANNINAMGVP